MNFSSRITGTTGTVDLYLSAFQWIEQPLYYLNKERNTNVNYRFSSNHASYNQELNFGKYVAISYIAWPLIMIATPLTAFMDIGIGIGEAFYAKYKGHNFHQIRQILQKKCIASPLQQLVYVVINLAFPIFAGGLFAISSFGNLSFLFFFGMFLSISPITGLVCYHIAQEVIGSKLPRWIRPEGFNVFIDHGALDPNGQKITDEDYVERLFTEWKEEKTRCAQVSNQDSLYEKLQIKKSLVDNLCQDDFKLFFNNFLERKSKQLLFGLPVNFSKQDLQKAYKKWALILHPDKHRENNIREVAEILFKEVFFVARIELEKELTA